MPSVSKHHERSVVPITVLAMGDSEGFCGGSIDMCRHLPTPDIAEDRLIIGYFWQTDGNCCYSIKGKCPWCRARRALERRSWIMDDTSSKLGVVGQRTFQIDSALRSSGSASVPAA